MLELILLSLGISCVTGVLSLVAGKARAASKVLACAGGMASAACALDAAASGSAGAVSRPPPITG